jgi:protein-S-isoprenylcysteine O-methyltransferase Ste14
MVLMMQFFIKWANRNTSVWQRLAILGLGAIIFPLLIPFIFAFLLTQIDAMIGLRFLLFSPIAFFIGAILVIIGGIVAIWTIVVQITLAGGTPFPMVPTRKLIKTGPFALCRNPMTLGTILAYYGISLMVGSITSAVATTVFTLLLFLYIKRIEEKELALRFGEEYLEYKAATPFIIPKMPTRRGN